MDRELLNALNNVAEALQQVADHLDNKKQVSSVGSAMQGGGFSGGLLEISEGIESLKEDNKKILDNQETIIKLQKQQQSPTSEVFQGAGKQKEMLKDGVSVIVLIAGAVMAIGLAFQLVGTVDWASVIALSISLPLIAYAFERIAEMKDLTPRNMASLFGVTATMASAIAFSSWALQLVIPVSPFQLATGLIIAGMFSIIASSMSELMSGASEYDKANVSSSSVLAMFGAVSAGIVAASWAMNLIVPISFSQGLTAIVISGTFAIISSSMSKMMKGVAEYEAAGIDSKKVLLALMSISGAITAASWVMNLIVPVSFTQGLTAIMISGTFAVVAMNMDKMMKGVAAFDKHKINPGKLFLSLVSISTAITASSWVMNLIVPISMTQALTSIVIAGIFAGISYFMDKIAIGMVILEKTMGVGKLFMMPLFFTAVSTAITASSIIMSAIVPLRVDQLLTVVGLGLALAVVTPVLGLSMVAVGRLGKVSDYLVGGASVLIIASTIAASSHILSMGEYGTYPDVSWVAGVGLSILTFGVSTLALGALMVASGGTGALVLAAGAASVVTLAFTIVATSHILAMGNYDTNAYPGIAWVGGVALTMTSFGIMTLGMAVMGPAILFGSMSILAVAGTIYSVSLLLSKGDYSKFPTTDWMSGAAMTLLKFGGVLAAFGVGSIMFGPMIAIGTASMVAMAGSIYTVSSLLSKGDYSKFPTTEWISGVSATLTSFVRAFREIDLLNIIATELLDFVGLGLPDIAEGILQVDRIFSQGNWMFYPDEYYMQGVKGAIFGYLDIVERLRDTDTIVVMADSFEKLGTSMERFSDSISSLDLEKMQAIRSLSSSVVMLSLIDPDQFDMMMTKLEQKSDVFGQLTLDMDKKRSESGTAVSVAGSTSKEVDMNGLGDKLDTVAALLADISSVVGSSGTLKNYLMSIRQRQLDDDI